MADVSVITPSYNQGRFIRATIESVLKQDPPPSEHLVIDGGSSDETVSILRDFSARLTWVSEPDRGQADAVNKGIRQSSGEIIGWLNSDDLYYPGTIRAVQNYFDRHPEIDLVYGDGHHIDEQGDIIESYYTEPWNPERLRDICFICQPTVFLRRSVVERCGLLDPGLQFCMDYEYWLRLNAMGMRFGHLQRYLAGSRLYRDNKTLSRRIAVHAEINRMTRSRLGKVPDRWLANYAHVVVEEKKLARDRSSLAFAMVTAGLSWWAALRWNRRLTRSLFNESLSWIRNARHSTGSGVEAIPEPTPIPGPRAAVRRIGFDVSQTGTAKAGCGYVADSLVLNLTELDTETEYWLYRTFGPHFWDPAGPGATRKIDRPNVFTGLSHASHNEARQFWIKPHDLESALAYPDIVHANNFFCPTGLETARLVYTLYDLHFVEHPDWTTESNRQSCFEGVFTASVNADLVVAISEATRQQYLRLFPHYPEHRVEVVSLACRLDEGADASMPAALTRLEGLRFLLHVGTCEPRKNQARLLEAFASFVEEESEPIILVIAGGSGWLNEDVERWLRDKRLANRVIRLGYVDDSELVWLYRNCLGFVYPSLAEGFGLPVIEAASQGAPVISSKVPSIEEVAGDAALLVDPIDPTAIKAAMSRIAHDADLRSDLGSAALAMARRFSWRTTARRVLELYDRVLDLERYRTDLSG